MNIDGHIWELDGRRDTPIHKGDCTPEKFGETISKVIKNYVDMDEGNLKFSMMALAPDTGVQAFAEAPLTSDSSASLNEKIRQLQEIVPDADEGTL